MIYHYIRKLTPAFGNSNHADARSIKIIWWNNSNASEACKPVSFDRKRFYSEIFLDKDFPNAIRNNFSCNTNNVPTRHLLMILLTNL